MTYPTGFSSGIFLVLFQPISKLGGSGFTRPVEDFLSRVISDFLRFSIGNFSALMVVSEFGLGKSGSVELGSVHLVMNK